MTIGTYSPDLWDYLGDMPYMPSRQERDSLVDAAKNNPAREKRVHIWDYFFRINPADVGKPQQTAIAGLRDAEKQVLAASARDVAATERSYQSRIEQLDRQYGDQRRGLEAQIALNEAVIGLRRWGLVGAIVVAAIGLWANGQESVQSQLAYLVLLLSPLLLLWALWGITNRSREISRLREWLSSGEQQYNQERTRLLGELEKAKASLQSNLEGRLSAVAADIRQLEGLIAALQAKIPAPATDDEMHRWLQDDIAMLAEQAEVRSGLATRLVKLAETDNPLCIMGPAELQDAEQIPEPYRPDSGVKDRPKHLTARRLTILPDGRFEDFYGVYNLEFILIAEDMLGTYGCFYDFILGRSTGERTSEQYYHDVVSINTRHVYREVRIDNRQEPIAIEDAPTFSLSLSSGEVREVAFASEAYFQGVWQQVDSATLAQFSVGRWARNPERAADNAIRALRARLRSHKGAPSDA